MKLGQQVAASPIPRSRNVAADQASYGKLVPGDTLDGRFLLGEVISRGGMAVVFRAEDLQNQCQPVAVKVPHGMFASGNGAWSRFQREEEFGCKLSHPCILRFVPVAGKNRGAYIVTEYLRGQTLADRLATGAPLTEAEALHIARRICEAVQYMHEQRVVHYDLKPGNVMLCADGSIRLIDLGLAQPVETRRFGLRSTPPAMGTMEYVSPEQIRRKPGRTSADIYAVGGILYKMLTGTVPFSGDDPFAIGSVRLTGDPVAPRKLNPDISPQAEEIVLRALQRDPARRYPTAAAMKADLDAPETVRVTGLCDSLQESTRWRRFLLLARWIAVVCILPLVIQILLFLFLWHHYGGKR
jgi:serine/threonine-protein kinase